MDFLFSFNFYSVLVRLLLATVLGGIIGIERGCHGRAAGLRTHILVCLGAAMTSLIGLYGSEILSNNGDIMRISAQVISGIGFLGVGMILVRNRTIVTGLTTAAGLWTTAAIGIAIGFGFYEGALIATLLCVIVTSLLGYFETKIKTVSNLYIEVSNVKSIRKTVSVLKEIIDVISVDIVSPKSSIGGNMGITVIARAHSVTEDSLIKIENLQDVEFVVEDGTSH